MIAVFDQRALHKTLMRGYLGALCLIACASLCPAGFAQGALNQALNMDAPQQDAPIAVTAISMDSVDQVNGMSPAPATQSGTSNNWAVVKFDPGLPPPAAPNFALVQATVNPGTVAAQQQIQWTGGTAVAGRPDLCQVPISSSSVVVVKATIGTSSMSLNLWIVWATVAILTTGNNPPNAVQFGPLPESDGTQQLGAITYPSGTLAWGKYCAVAQLTPAGVGATFKNGWFLVRYLQRANYMDGVPIPTETDSGLIDDTSHPEFQVDVPDANDSIYDIDAPFVSGTGSSHTSIEVNINFVEVVDFVQFNIAHQCALGALLSYQARWNRNLNPEIQLNSLVGGAWVHLPPQAYYSPP